MCSRFGRLCHDRHRSPVSAFLAWLSVGSATALLILSINVRLMGIVDCGGMCAKHDAARNNRLQEATPTRPGPPIEQRAEMIRRCFLLALISLAGTIASCLLPGFRSLLGNAAIAAVVIFVLAMICLMLGTFYYIREVIRGPEFRTQRGARFAVHGSRHPARRSTATTRSRRIFRRGF
jgi:hypothetical protein